MADYWTVSSGVANYTGHTCRECRRTIFVNTPICVRDGRKIRLFYHASCFSGDSDPRTQPQSSILRWEGGLSSRAPPGKGYGKWWTSGYGYEGGLQHGRVLLPSTAQQTDQRATSTLRQHKQADSGKPRGRSASLVMTSPAFKDDIPPGSSSSSTSVSATSGKRLQRSSSVRNTLSKLKVLTKDAEDGSMRNAARSRKDWVK